MQGRLPYQNMAAAQFLRVFIHLHQILLGKQHLKPFFFRPERLFLEIKTILKYTILLSTKLYLKSIY